MSGAGMVSEQEIYMVLFYLENVPYKIEMAQAVQIVKLILQNPPNVLIVTKGKAWYPNLAKYRHFWRE